MLYYLDLFGTVVFAISGILQARRLRMDMFGMLVLATVTAIGGGTLRDMALGVAPVFWVRQQEYLIVIILTSLLAVLFFRVKPWKRAYRLLLLADAVGLATFTAIGVEKALSYGASPVVAVGMGVLTGVGGGIVRDVLAREVPMVLRTEIYATACIAGGIVHTAGIASGLPNGLSLLFGVMVTLLLRLAAIRWKLKLPVVGHPTL